MKAKQLIFLLVFLLVTFSFKSTFSQNQLSNGGFESGTYDCYSKSAQQNYVDGLDSWESDYYFQQAPLDETFHSPNWFDVNCPQYDEVVPAPGGGDRLCHVSTYDLIEQELTGSNKLEPNHSYLISCYIYLVFPFSETLACIIHK